MLEFYVKMKDLMSSGVAKLAATAREKFTQVQTYINQTIHGNEKLADSFAKVERKIKSSSGAMPGWVSNLTAAVGVMGLMAFGGSSISQAMDFGATKQSFSVLTGDKAKGEALANELNKLQQETILGPSVFKNAQTLMGFGVAANRVVPILKMLGDVSMGDENKLAGLTLAFSQVSAAGKLSGQDLLQMINAGYNPLNDISKMTGKSIGQLKKEMESGAITSDMVAKAFERATGKGGLYNNMLNTLAETPFGKLQQLKGQFESLKVKVGEALMPIAEMFMTVAGFLMDHTELIVAAGVAWLSYTVIVKGASTATAIWNAITKANPIARVISLIAALITWIGFLVNKYEGWGASLQGLWDIIKGFVRLNVIAWREMGETIWYWVQYAWLKVKGFVEYCGQAIANIGEAFIKATTLDFSGASDAISREIVTTASLELKQLEKNRDVTKAINASETADAMKQMAEGWSKVGLHKRHDIQSPASSIGAAAINNNAPVKNGPTSTPNKDVASGITGGGPRVINVTIGKMVEKIEIHALSTDEGLERIDRKVEEQFLRILNSGASVQ